MLVILSQNSISFGFYRNVNSEAFGCTRSKIQVGHIQQNNSRRVSHTRNWPFETTERALLLNSRKVESHRRLGTLPERFGQARHGPLEIAGQAFAQLLPEAEIGRLGAPQTRLTEVQLPDQTGADGAAVELQEAAMRLPQREQASSGANQEAPVTGAEVAFAAAHVGPLRQALLAEIEDGHVTDALPVDGDGHIAVGFAPRTHTTYSGHFSHGVDIYRL